MLSLHSNVRDMRLPWVAEIDWLISKRRRPIVLMRKQVAAMLVGLDGVHLMSTIVESPATAEALQLGVKNLDFGQYAIIIRDGLRGMDRLEILPRAAARS